MRALSIYLSGAFLVLALGGCEVRPYTITFGDGGQNGGHDGGPEVSTGEDAGKDAQKDTGPDVICVPTEEVCNGLDDDCDGVTDNVATDKLQSDPNNCGACGRKCVLPHANGSCVDGACVFECWAAWVDTNHDLGLGLNGSDGCECLTSNGGVEICDGKDNNCDGQTDESDPDIGSPCAPSSGCPNGICRGTCSMGSLQCHQDGYLACVGAVGPTPEICDGLDNNCDGNTDEGVDVQLCYPHATGCDLTTGVCKGVCKLGVRLCQGVAGFGDCNGDVGPSTEICDGLDNNCDGNTDEGTLPSVGDPCYPTQGCPGGVCRGICRPGTQVCNAGRLECLNPIGPQPEVCDGLDNDCNGVTDDGLPPKACYNQAGNGCTFASGTWTCKGICRLGWIVCRGQDGWSGCEGDVGPQPEECNGIDDNCDGQIDNGTMAGVAVACYPSQGCPGGVCKGECAAGTTVCTNGNILCPDAKGPSVEVCDGKDNNCDGQTDENLPDRSCYTLGNHCDPQTGVCVGACRLGHTTCTGGGWSGCLGQTGPTTEQCNGIDDDCDGVTDNPPSGGGNLPGVGVACYPPQGCPGGACKGECAAGTTVCQTGQVVCPDAKGPTQETCNGKDDDCDGVTDNGMTPQLCYPTGTLGCDPNTGACKGICRFGRKVCTGVTGWSGCDSPAPVTPATEQCNGVDDDCDGVTDNGTMPGVAVPCYPAQGCPGGVCRGECRAGTTTCQTGQVVCPDARGPATEVCDNKDNDCDGVTDGLEEACYTGGAECTISTGQCAGVCRVGLKTCSAGTWGSCAGEVKPTAETCNAKDDDCDGLTDENLAGTPLSQSCYTGPAGTQNVGPCHGGAQLCQAATGTWGACTGQVTPAVETCNNVDDDCDGVTDGNQEACYTGGAECNVGTGQCAGVCRVGLWTCAHGAWGSCVGEVKPKTETCNAMDDDCDGTVDGTAGVLLTQSCYTGPAGTQGVGVCHGGTQTCVPANGTWGACAGQVVPGVESCNNLDDDCDHITDNIAPRACYPTGTPGCNLGTQTCIGECRFGTAFCSSGLEQCGGPLKTPSAEQCNGKDDNCDGFTDNGGPLPGEGVVCYPSAGCPSGVCVGACHAGAMACTNGGLVCVGAQGPVPETCNNVDDDCDGVPDSVEFDFANNVYHCGACNHNCNNEPGATNAVARCETGTCKFTCLAGYYDLDGNPANGCEYACTPTGLEVCDGIDNDCDGKIDLVDTDAPPNGLITVSDFCDHDGACSGAAPVCQAYSPIQLGDQNNQLSAWDIDGASLTNTAAGVIYATVSDSAGTRAVQLYRHAALGASDLVAQGSRLGDGMIALAAANGSGLTGSLKVTYTAADSTISFVVPLPADFNDENNQLASWAFYGASTVNTNAGVLYATLTNSSITRTVSLYKNPALGASDLVAQGTRDNDGWVILSERNSSGLTGSVNVTYTANDNSIQVPVPLPRDDGDGSNQLAAWSIKGATELSTDSGFLYATLQDASGTRTVSLYHDAGMAPSTLVAQGSRAGDGLVTLVQQNDSGLAGSVQVAYTAPDTTITVAVPIYTWVCSYDRQKVEVVGLNEIAVVESRCDNVDNNCDGSTDEPFFTTHAKGSACSQDGTSGQPLVLGQCRGTGFWTCSDCPHLSPSRACTGLGDTAVCDLGCNVAGCKAQTAPAPETCNGLDENCNGILDDGAPDEQIRVGAAYPGVGYWVDKYEAARPDATSASDGALEHRSCSMLGVLPWGSVSHDVAAAACLAAGKRLCTESEWGDACGGGPTTDINDNLNQLSGWEFYGATAANTNNGTAYVTLTNSVNTRTVNVYRDAGHTALVAQGFRLGNGQVDLVQVGSSGLTGSVQVAYSADDLDISVWIQWRYPYSFDTYQPNSCNGYEYDPDCTGGNNDLCLPTGTPMGCPTKPGISLCTNPTYATVDMSGNLREWTATPVGTPTAYVIRGGSYDDISTALTCQFDFWALPPTYFLPNIGFRCCTRCPYPAFQCPSATVCTVDGECGGGFCDPAVDAAGLRHCAYCLDAHGSDGNNCGACGHVCGVGTTCQSGVCK
jgi:hypothetical protein